MNRFYCSAKNVSGGRIVIGDREQAHHIRDVIRLEPGEPAVVFDDNGSEYDCTLEEILQDKIVFSVRKIMDRRNSGVHIAVACAIPKHSRIDDIIDKLTQLGVDRIIPLMTERVIVRMDRDKESGRLQRWSKIAAAASKQSHRNSIPLVDGVTVMEKIPAVSAGYDLKLIPTLAGGLKSLKDVLRGAKPKKIIVLIGPEGDFTPDEVSAALSSGFVPVSLGDSVLRVETAAIYSASTLRYEFSQE